MPVYARVMLICCFAAMLLASGLWAASYAWPIYPANATFENGSVKADATSVRGQAGVRVYIGELPFMAAFDPCNDEVWREYRLLPVSFAIYPGRKLDFGMEEEIGRYAVVAVSYWFLFAASALSAFLIWKLVPRRPAKGACSRCGYDLRASKNTCPECGNAFELSDQSSGQYCLELKRS